jgi:tight adherence protein B
MSAALVCLALAAAGWPTRPRRPVVPDPLPAVRRRPFRLALPGPLRLAVGAGSVATVLVTPVVGALAAVCGAAAGRVLRRRAEASAERRRSRALAEALGVLAAEVRAGRSLAEATGTAVDGCPDPGTALELAPVLRLGEPPPPEPGLSGVPGGSGGEVGRALVRVAAAVRLSAATGCSLAGVVTAVEDDLRARLRAEDELRAAVAGPRASAAVLAGLPVLGLLMGGGVGADPWHVLTTTVPGTLLLVAGVLLELAGLLWTARLVRRAVDR